MRTTPKYPKEKSGVYKDISHIVDLPIRYKSFESGRERFIASQPPGGESEQPVFGLLFLERYYSKEYKGCQRRILIVNVDYWCHK